MAHNSISGVCPDWCVPDPDRDKLVGLLMWALRQNPQSVAWPEIAAEVELRAERFLRGEACDGPMEMPA